MTAKKKGGYLCSSSNLGYFFIREVYLYNAMLLDIAFITVYNTIIM